MAAFNFAARRKAKTTTSDDKLQDLLDQLNASGVEAPTTKPGPNLLNRLVGFLSLGETAPAVQEWMKTGSLGAGISKYKETATSRASGQGLGKNVSYADVMKDAGVGEMGSMNLPFLGKVTGRGAVGLVGDILLDPTTYLTGGLSGLGKTAGKKTFGEVSQELAERAMKEAGGEMLTPAFKQAGRTAAIASPEALGRTAVEQAGKGQRSLLNFMGQPILPKGVNEKAYQTMSDVGQKLGKWAETEDGIKGIPGRMYKATTDMFRPAAKPLSKWGDAEFAEKWNKLTEIKQQYKNVKAVGQSTGEEYAGDVTKELRTLLKGSKKLDDYEVVMKDVVDAVERKVPIEQMPEHLQGLTRQMQDLSTAYSERWLKAGGARMTYDNLAYVPHVMNPKVKDLIGKGKGGFSSRMFSGKNPADNPRSWVKLVKDDGTEVIGHIDELAAQMKLSEIDVKGLPPGVFSGNQAWTMQQLQEHLQKTRGITLRYSPTEKLWKSTLGYYLPVSKKITVTTGRKPKEVFETIEHEVSHADDGLWGEINQLERTFSGKPTKQSAAFQQVMSEADIAVKEEWEQIIDAIVPDFSAKKALKQLSSKEKRYMYYFKQPTELRAHATQYMYENIDDAATRFPKSVEALEKVKEAYAAIRGTALPGWNEIPPDNFKAGIDKLFVGPGGKIYQLQGATIKEINEKTTKDYGVELFSVNIPILEHAMATRVANKEAGKEFFTMIKELGEFGPGKRKKGWRELTTEGLEGEPDLIQSAAKELKNSGLVFPPEVVDHIDALYKGYFSDKATKGVMKMYDTMLNAWKGSVTSVFPAFHGRNFLSNVWQNYLGGVQNPLLYTKAASLRSKVSLNKPLSEAEQKLWDKFTEQGLAGYGYFGADISKQLEKNLPVPSVLNKAKGAIPGAFEKGRQIGNVVEDTAKLAHFMDKLNKGFSNITAAQSVRKYLFDYSDLTQFEKNFMKRLMPFYTFSRKNLPMELEAYLTNPGKFSTLVKGMRGAGFEFGETDSLPEWLRGQPVQRTVEGDKERVGYGLDVPAFDIINYMEGTREGGIGVRRSMEKTIGRLTSPIIKTPLEWMSGKHWYYGKDLADTATVYPVAAKALQAAGVADLFGIIEKKNKDGETYYATTNPEAWHVMKSLFGRGYTAISRTAEEKGWEERLRSNIFGQSTKELETQEEIDSINYELMKKIGEWGKQRGIFKSFTNYYKEKEKKGVQGTANKWWKH